MSDSEIDPRLLEGVHGIDPRESAESLQQKMTELESALAKLPADAAAQQAEIEVQMAEASLGLGRNGDAWSQARGALDALVDAESWQSAVDACDVLYRSDQDDSIVALGHGVWLAVTYPVAPQSTVSLLHYIVDETPEQSDGAPVAAMTAQYIADLRTEGKEKENLTFITTQILAQVAKRHRGIEGKEYLDIWIETLELNDTRLLLQRLGKMVDIMVGDNWWFDRDALRARLPVN